MPNPRQIAVEGLLKIELDSGWSNLVLDHIIEKNNLSQRDSAFTKMLIFGVLERQITLDACIKKHCSTRLKKLSPAVKIILRLGVYQLLYMDTVPDSAAINESVKLVSVFKMEKSKALVNAVLRSFLRSEKQIPIPEGASEEERLSVIYSCPAPIVELWLKSYKKEDVLRFLEDSLLPAPLFIRVNTQKTSATELARLLEERGIEMIDDPDLDSCKILKNTGAAQNIPEFKEGLFHLQDKASQLCVECLFAKRGDRILDACAAPGGKTFTLAEIIEDCGEIVAADIHPHRVSLIANRALQMGFNSITPIEEDMSLPQLGMGAFDCILCDVPCSGLGVIRRKPEIKYKFMDNFTDISNLQYKILENSAQYLKVGGRLVYSTCTLNPCENQLVVERFLENNRHFRPAELLPCFKDETSHTLIAEGGCDGFFISAFTRID